MFGTHDDSDNVVEFPCAPNMPNVTAAEHGTNGDTNDAVENPETGYPLCTGGCGLPIGPVDVAKGRTHHGFCA